MLIALASVKHAPGVTTTALGLASAWPHPVLLAECDPAGADLPAWLARPAAGGLLDGLLELRRTDRRTARTLWQQALSLDDDGGLRLLSGLDDLSQAAAVEGMWPLLAPQLTWVSDEDGHPVDVLLDCGRLADRSTPWPLLETADVAAIVLRPTVAGVRLTSRWLPHLQDRLAGDGLYGKRLRLLVIGDGPYPAGEVAEALNVPLLGVLPDDPTAAALIAAGGGRGLHRSRLWRGLTQLANDLTDQQTSLSTPSTDPSSEGVIEAAASAGLT